MLALVTGIAQRPLGAASTCAAPELQDVRVLLVHEWLYTWAGSERCLEQLAALMPHADVLAGIVTPEMRDRHEVAARARESWVGRIPGSRRHHRWFLPLHALAFSQFDTSSYDLVVSISHAFEKAVRARKTGGIHLSYCLTPPRYLWDLATSHDAFASPIQRVALRAARPSLRAIDLAAATGVHHFVSLAQHVAERVRRTYHRDSTVVYPPVATKPARRAREKRQSFLLSLGRLVPYKRVDLAIAAAERLRLRLVVAGEGPDRARLERLGGRYTEFVGSVSEEQAGDLFSTCAALVFCGEEDFGIVPVEANAHGAPVVAYACGGARETMREGVTGVFFREQAVEPVLAAIQECLARAWDGRALRDNAERFVPERFREGMRGEIAKALAGRSE